MIDRIFSASLVFSLLAFGTATIATAMFVAPKPAMRQVVLERVVITAKRADPVLAQTQADVPALRSVQ